jgi:hypothetical protein
MWNTYSQFDWLGYLTLAKELRKREQDEAAIRTSISRAYYATYHKAREFLDQRNVHITRVSSGPGGAQTFNTHDALWKAFSDSKDVTWRKVGEEGDRLKRKRVMADYESYINKLVPNVADETLQKADRILQLLSTL